MSNTFQVDNVQINSDGLQQMRRFYETSGEDYLEALSGLEPKHQNKIEQVCESQPGLLIRHGNALVGTVGLAYDNHLPLTLSPDHIWTVIMQGVARHLEMDPEASRAFFVSHAEQKELVVIRDEFIRGQNNDWLGAFKSFNAQIEEHIGPEKHALLNGKFSTTGDLEAAMSSLAVMDAMKNYFSYTCWTRCGIPQITLTGNPEDWKLIKAKTESLQEIGLGWWVTPLGEVLDHFISASQGNPDVSFWKSFFKETDHSGGPDITGWIGVFFPWVLGYGSSMNTLIRNPNLGKVPVLTNFQCRLHDIPGTMSTVPMLWKYHGQDIPMALRGGLIGTSLVNGRELTPTFGWCIQEASPN